MVVGESPKVQVVFSVKVPPLALCSCIDMRVSVAIPTAIKEAVGDQSKVVTGVENVLEVFSVSVEPLKE